jgi:hydroxymethylpyrimidine kinase/phosphomethylpyrimidine kinase/thiamine-phosphate diphosphorylase
MPIRARSTFGTEFASAPAGRRPVVWSIAGSDSGAGAGLQADLKALQAFGVHGCTAVAAITAQNSVAVTQVEPTSAALLDAQLKALAQDMPPQAIKTGLLGSVDNVRVVCEWVDRLRAQGHAVPLVVDPVLGSTTGASFANQALVDAYRQQLLPRATLITPNHLEAIRLLDVSSPLLASAALDVQQVEQLAQQLRAQVAVGTRAWGAASALARQTGISIVLTGGDATGGSQTAGLACDFLLSPQATGWLSVPRVATTHHHGTGCTFASTAAAALASGYCVADAVVLAKMATTHALRHAYAAGRGAGPVHAAPDFAQHAANLPWLQTQPSAQTAFPALRNPALGVYAVVDSAVWVKHVLESGIRTVQLRIKDPAEPTLAAQITESIAIANATPGAQLFINDHWQLALQLGAYGVHLGQEDVDTVDLDALRNAGVRVGLSTHSYWEVARAWGLHPSYVACGPIFATQSKDMPWIPQGLDNLRYWADVLPLPVVGIAGIDASNVTEVAATGAASAAVISAITKADNPEQACADLQRGFAAGANRSQDN